MRTTKGVVLSGERAPVRANMDRWRAGLPPDAWPDTLPASGEIWRRDVFATADTYRAGSATARQLLTAVLIWAYGPIGYGPWRATRSLAADPDGKRLAYALEELSTPAPDEAALGTAYRRFGDPDHARLPWLGPGLFTKVLYFVGYRRGVGGVQPLILDRVVAGLLPAEAGVGRRNDWSSEEWLAYLRRAAEQARIRGVEPDAVEMALAPDR
ncbi:8-oxoguanine DNA glycosylase OGG fold protein [Micromonospora sp. CPCC 205558]|uniref:8-oxoguanine DNA glycosylase OGG fold protein n=1 Tax=Micromonospora sp. CPCC 205558 TaxID=3122403 RepID=UPI002FEEC770